MSTIANPNWLAITAAFVMVTGVALLARAAICGSADAPAEQQRLLAASRRSLNTYLGGASLAVGTFMHIASQMTAPGLNFMLIVFSLLLAFGLLLYACLEDLWVENMVPVKEAKQAAPRLQLIAPPAPALAAEPREPVVTAALRIDATALP